MDYQTHTVYDRNLRVAAVECGQDTIIVQKLKEMMSKVIFLDIDGVLNSTLWNENHQKEISKGLLIDKEKVRLLAELVRLSNAKIVLHSGWKFWLDEQGRPINKESEKLVLLLNNAGLQIEEVTPDLTTEEIRREKKFSLVKANEILQWLSDHSEVVKWVVLDDLDLHNEKVLAHQIQIDANAGLTKEDVHKALEILAADGGDYNGLAF